MIEGLKESLNKILPKNFKIPLIFSEKVNEVVEISNFEELSYLIKKINNQGHYKREDALKLSSIRESLGSDVSIGDKILLSSAKLMNSYFKEGNKKKVKLIDSFHLHGGIMNEHREVLAENGIISNASFVSMAFDLVGEIKDNEISRVFKLKENNGEFELDKISDFTSLLNNPEFLLQGSEGKEMFKILKIAYSTPGFIPTLQKFFLKKKGSFFNLTFRGQAYLVKEFLKTPYLDIHKMKFSIENFSHYEKSIFWEALGIIDDEKVKEKFLEISRNEKTFKNHEDHTREERENLRSLGWLGKNIFLEKTGELFKLIDNQREYVYQNFSHEVSQDFDPWEYNKALKKRFYKMINQTNEAKSKKEVKKIIESETFSMETLITGSLMRGAKNIDSMKDVYVVIENGREGLFSIEDIDDIEKFIDLGNQKNTPKWSKVLKGKLKKEISDPNVKWVIVKRNNKIAGIRKIKYLKDGTCFLGTFYVSPEFQNDFNVGRELEEMTLQNIPQNRVGKSNVSPYTNAIHRHLKHNRIITGIVTEKFEDIESEEIFETQTNLDLSQFKSREISEEDDLSDVLMAEDSEDLFAREISRYSMDDYLEKIKKHTNEGLVVTKIIRKGDSDIIFFEKFN